MALPTRVEAIEEFTSKKREQASHGGGALEEAILQTDHLYHVVSIPPIFLHVRSLRNDQGPNY